MIIAIPFPEISPEIFSVEVFGLTLALRWYAMAYVAGILIGAWLIAIMARRPALWANRRPALLPKHVESLVTWMVLGIILGGRLGFVLFYQPQHYLANPAEIPQVWQGGMSFHGGFVGVVLAILIFARRQGIPLGSAADTIALASPPAILLGRIANFVNAELWGRATTLPWGVIFPGEAAQSCASLTSLCARHPSQLYEAGLEGLVLGLLLIFCAFRGGFLRQPWLISAVFFTFYGLSRFAVEFVRQPDAQFVSPGNPLGLALHLNGFGLTMGQLLTLPMIAVGLALIVTQRRRRG